MPNKNVKVNKPSTSSSLLGMIWQVINFPLYAVNALIEHRKQTIVERFIEEVFEGINFNKCTPKWDKQEQKIVLEVANQDLHKESDVWYEKIKNKDLKEIIAKLEVSIKPGLFSIDPKMVKSFRQILEENILEEANKVKDKNKSISNVNVNEEYIPSTPITAIGKGEDIPRNPHQRRYTVAKPVTHKEKQHLKSSSVNENKQKQHSFKRDKNTEEEQAIPNEERDNLIRSEGRHKFNISKKMKEKPNAGEVVCNWRSAVKADNFSPLAKGDSDLIKEFKGYIENILKFIKNVDINNEKKEIGNDVYNQVIEAADGINIIAGNLSERFKTKGNKQFFERFFSKDYIKSLKDSIEAVYEGQECDPVLLKVTEETLIPSIDNMLEPGKTESQSLRNSR